MTLDRTLLRGVRTILRARTKSFVALAKRAGLDPATDFRRADLRDVDFATDDIAGFDFSGADLRGARLDRVQNRHRAIFTGAILDDAGEAIPRPPWSSASGRDQYGTYADFTLPGTTITQRLRWVPPGRFTMGSPASEAGRRDNEGPQHEVVFVQGYWLFDTPCTQALWQGVMGNNPSRFAHPLRPVENVNFNQVQSFIAKLNARLPGLELCLPSEAEFERATRAGTATATWAGDMDIQGEYNAPLLHPIAWYGGNSGLGYDLDEREDSADWPEKQFEHSQAGTRQVKTREANPWGFYDLLGNVWEWCADTWHDSYYDAPEDGSAWIDNEAGPAPRVFRGGAWDYPARFVRAAVRYSYPPDSRGDSLGFRCARVHVTGEAERRAARRERPARSARAAPASPERSGEANSSSSPRPKGEKF